MALDVSCRDDGSADHRWWDRRRWEKRPIRDAQTRLRVSQVKPQLDVSWWSVSCIEHACLPVIVHICPGTQILVSWRVTTMRIYRMWGSKACQASDRRLWCLTSVCPCITSAVHPWIEFRAQPQCKILFWWYECHPSMWRDQPNGTELTLVSLQFLSCCRPAGLQCSGSCPAIISGFIRSLKSPWNLKVLEKSLKNPWILKVIDKVLDFCRSLKKSLNFYVLW